VDKLDTSPDLILSNSSVEKLASGSLIICPFVAAAMLDQPSLTMGCRRRHME
jgi:hypothetical protein